MVYERGFRGRPKQVIEEKPVPQTPTTPTVSKEVPFRVQQQIERETIQEQGQIPATPEQLKTVYTKAQAQQQLAKQWIINLKNYIQQRQITTGQKNRIIPTEQYIMQEKGPTWSKGQILTGSQIQSYYSDIESINRVSFMEYQRGQRNLSRAIIEYHPETKVEIKTNPETGEKEYNFIFPYAGAEYYKTYEKMINENRNIYLAGRFFTSPTLNVDYTLSKSSQEKTDIMVKWLHSVRGSPEGGFDFGRMTSTIGSSPFVNMALLAGGSTIYGAGRGAITGYFIGSKALTANKILTAAELGVGGYFGYEAAKNIKKTYETEGFGAALGTGISTGLIVGGGIVGFKAGSTYKFTRGFPKGSSGYTSTEFGAHKGTLNYVNKLENTSIKTFGGKTTYEPVYKNVYVGEDFNWFQKTNVGTKLKSISPEQAVILRSFERNRFMAQGIYGNVGTFIGLRGMIGQKDFDVSFSKAETMKGQPKRFVEFAQKQATMKDSQLFGGSTYKSKGAHDIDIMVRNLSQYTRRVEYGGSKFNLEPTELGMDIKPYVKPGKVISTSGSLKQEPYVTMGKYGDIETMRWSETASRLGDASKLPTSRRVQLNIETGKLEAKDINSYLNMVSRLHYQAGGKKTLGFDMEGFLKTGKAWEENFVQMGTYEESSLFDTKTLPEKWAVIKNKVYKNVLPEKWQTRFQEKNFQDIMGFNENIKPSRQISEMPPSPNISSNNFNSLISPIIERPTKPSSFSKSNYILHSPSIAGYSKPSSSRSKSISSSILSSSILGGYPSRYRSISLSSGSLSPSPYSPVSRYSPKYSYSPSKSSSSKSSSIPYGTFYPIGFGGGSEGSGGYSPQRWYARKFSLIELRIPTMKDIFGGG